MPLPVVIVGTGLAGYNLAREFRKLDNQTPLVLITADDGRSYSKPMLSNGFAKNKNADELVMAEVGVMAQQLNARILTHTLVTQIDPAQRTLWLGAEPLAYRDLVLACGAQSLMPTLTGNACDALLGLNDLQDYARLRAHMQAKQRLLILGAGLIGCEIANDMAAAGFRVQVAALSEQLMPDLLPSTLAGAVQQRLQAEGVSFQLGVALEHLEHHQAGFRARLSNGQCLDVDAVLSAIGLKPRVQLAQDAGLSVGRGVRVDAYLRTSEAHIYALGDCAEVDGVNLLYVMPLMQGARALAKTLAGTATSVSYGVMPVMVKTPACPIVVVAPALGASGQWQIQGQGHDLQAEFRSPQGQLLGYALLGAAVMQKMALNREISARMS